MRKWQDVAKRGRQSKKKTAEEGARVALRIVTSKKQKTTGRVMHTCEVRAICANSIAIVDAARALVCVGAAQTVSRVPIDTRAEE